MVDDSRTPDASTASPDTDDARAAAIRFVTPDVTDEEAAAVIAVLLATLDEGAVSAPVDEPRRHPWVRSGHSLRTPIAVGPGEWARSGR